MSALPCRSSVSFAGAGIQCQRPEGHDVDEDHEATVRAQYGAMETWMPGRGPTEVQLMWQAPVEGASLYEKRRKACADGFHWIGQRWSSCGECGLPAWEHAGMSELPPGAGPFNSEPFVLRPWRPGEADAIRAKWETS